MTSTAATTRPVLVRSTVAAAAGLIAATAYPPFDLGVTIFVGLVPLVWLWRDASPSRAALYGFVWGFAFFGVVMYWIYFFGAVAFVPLMGALAGTIALIGLVVALLRLAGAHSAWVTAAVWTLVEMARGRFPLGGLPWAEVGVALHDFPPARALARWGGVPLVTFVAVALAGLIVSGFLAARDRARGRGAQPAIGIGILALVTLAATLTISAPPATEELRFALLQGNDLNRRLTAEEIEADLITRKHVALAGTLRGNYDLIVFPESSFADDPQGDPVAESQIERVARAHDAFVLMNGPTPAGDDREYNENLLYSPGGQVVGRYAKRHLVPFGEYVPLRDFVDWIPAVDQITWNYEPGDEQTIFDIRGVPVASVICFENAFAPLVRGAVRDGAEVLVVSTNNRSYRRSSNAAQHVALSQMRAAETGRPILHASISGVTAVIDEDGDVTQESELFVNSVTEGTVTARGGQTPFVRYGAWAGWMSGLILIVAGAIALRRRTENRPESLVDSTV